MSARKTWWWKAEAIVRTGDAYDLSGDVHASSLPTAQSRAALAVVRSIRRERIKRQVPPAAVVWCRIVVGGDGEPHQAIERGRG